MTSAAIGRIWRMSAFPPAIPACARAPLRDRAPTSRASSPAMIASRPGSSSAAPGGDLVQRPPAADAQSAERGSMTQT